MVVSPTSKEADDLELIGVKVKGDLQAQVLGAVQLPPLRHEGLQTAVRRDRQYTKRLIMNRLFLTYLTNTAVPRTYAER